jgi:structural maintenance of chromosomes protein 5
MELVGKSGGASFVIGNVLHNVSRSRYGKMLAQSMTRDINPARFLGKANGEHTLCKDAYLVT